MAFRVKHRPTTEATWSGIGDGEKEAHSHVYSEFLVPQGEGFLRGDGGQGGTSGYHLEQGQMNDFS